MDLSKLDARLDAAAAELSQRIKDHPDCGEFWSAFAGDIDCLFEQSDGHFERVRDRIDKTLADNQMLPDNG